MEINEIIAGCKRKNIKAQELLYKMYCAKMKRICMKYADNSEDAQDIHQEGFIKIFESIKDLKEHTYLETWMVRIFINTAYEHYRKKKKNDFAQLPENEDITQSQFSEEEEDAYLILADQMSAEEISEIINSIPYPYHLVFKLYYMDGISHKEIAETLNMNENNSRIILHRAKAMLKKLFEAKIHKMSVE